MIQIVDGDLPREALTASASVRTVGMDIETSRLNMVNGQLDKSTGQIAMVQTFIPEYGTVMVRNLVEWPTNLALLLESPRTTKIFHYSSFDLYFLMRTFPYIFPTAIADTKVAAAFFDPDKTYFTDDTGKGSHSLKWLVKKVFNYEMNKGLAISDWFAELSPEQIEYAAKDVEFLPSLLSFLEKGIEKRDVSLMSILAESYRFLPTKVMIDLKVGRDVFAYQ